MFSIKTQVICKYLLCTNNYSKIGAKANFEDITLKL